ncbi:GntR family transcriptional regulator [Ruegeria lacuscaerulensis]|uniref:GntR family transcriptional regulator n=1 Tax=Ruegeria lacuscaerulensis TaxID=55218 RepID=UPI00147C3EFC|nr:GntR family transcriptional regulator [Ruegeria lacuscaerulensis]
MKKPKLRRDGTPLYLQVADVMRQRILSGRWATGDFLPTIDKLVQEFEVARITVRDAVKILESEGLVEPRRGRGTMVLPHQLPTRPLSVVTSLAELVDLYRGDVPDLVSLDDTEADLPDGVTFGKAAPKYHKLRRIHSRDGQQYCVIALYIAKAVFDRHEALLRTELALPVLFDDPNLHIETARQSLIVSKCDLETAGLLDLKVGEPMAEVRRIMCDDKGEIFYLADVVYRGDYVRLDMDLMA